MISSAIYNIWFRPLPSYPGSSLVDNGESPALHDIKLVMQGTATTEIKRLDEEHGHVVRVNPDILSFT